MKILILLLFPFVCPAQFFAGLGATNNGVYAEGGYLKHSYELKLAYKLPMTRTDVPNITSLQLGRTVSLEKNFSITPSAGVARYKVLDFSSYDGGGQIIQVAEWNPIYEIELGWDKGAGRIFTGFHFCKQLYYSVGIKFYTR